MFSFAFTSHNRPFGVNASLRGLAGVFRPFASPPAEGFGDELLFTLREDCKRRVFLDRVVALVGVAISVGDQQLTVLEAYNGARSF